MSKIKAIIKRPDEPAGHVTNISNTLENFQKTVGGKIEMVRLGDGLILVVNEEGKLLGLEPNFRIGFGAYEDLIVGTAIVVGEDCDDLDDCPISMQTWKEFLRGVVSNKL